MTNVNAIFSGGTTDTRQPQVPNNLTSQQEALLTKIAPEGATELSFDSMTMDEYQMFETFDTQDSPETELEPVNLEFLFAKFGQSVNGFNINGSNPLAKGIGDGLDTLEAMSRGDGYAWSAPFRGDRLIYEDFLDWGERFTPYSPTYEQAVSALKITEALEKKNEEFIDAGQYINRDLITQAAALDGDLGTLTLEEVEAIETPTETRPAWQASRDYTSYTQEDDRSVISQENAVSDPSVSLENYLDRLLDSAGMRKHYALNPLSKAADTLGTYTPFETSIAGGSYVLDFTEATDSTLQQVALNGISVTEAIDAKNEEFMENQTRYITTEEIQAADQNSDGNLTVSEVEAIHARRVNLPLIKR